MDLRQKTHLRFSDIARAGRQRPEAAFTLIEVILAILILASALVVIIGLQYSSVERTLRDRTQQTAMLLARSILAGIENEPELVDEQETTMPAYELAQEYLAEGFDADQLDTAAKSIQAALIVTKFEIPAGLADPIQMKEVRLRMFWGESSEEDFEILYYIPHNERL